MAIAATTVWEVNGGATAGCVNGGGFNPANTGNGGTHGTDLSQSLASSYNATDLVGANANTATPTVTSATHTFVGADCGNLIHINSGTNWTAGWYEILSVSAGAATLDRACASVAAPTAGTYHVGGAISLGSVADATWALATTAGNITWIKNSVLSIGVTTSWTSSSSTSPGQILGYNTARGDNPTGANRPSISLGVFIMGFPSVSIIKNIIVTGTGTAVVGTATSTKYYNLKVINTSTTAGRTAMNLGTNAAAENCEFISYRGIAVTCSTATAVLLGCYIHDSDVGVGATSGIMTMINNVVADNVTAGYKSTTPGTGAHYFFGNTFYGAENKLGSGIRYETGSPAIRAMNNIFYGFGIGLDVNDVLGGTYADYNAYFNCTTNSTNVPVGDNEITANPSFAGVAQITGTNGTTSGFVLTSSGANFSTVTDNVDFVHIVSGTGVTAGKYLIVAHTSTTVTLDIAPGTSAVADKVFQVTTGHNFAVGTNMQAAAFPGLFPAGLSTGYMDIGAVQRKERASTDPGIANVRLGQAYTINDAALTGTAAIPTAANVRSGTATDAATGTLAVPIAANVRSGVAVDATTGTCAVPTAANVRTGIAVDATTGTAAIPTAANVRSGVAIDAGTGTLVVPTLANTKIGVAGDGGTGTYDGSDRWTDPGQTNVRLSTAYKANSLVNNKNGSAAIPTAADVRTGVAVDAGTGTCAVPTAPDVRTGVAVDATTGTLTLPAVSDVRLSVVYDGGTKTGTVNVPPIGKVQLGFAYDASNSLTGTMPPAGGGSYTFGGS